MTCEAVLPELVSYHFGLLESGERTQVEGHLATCPSCVAAFIDLKRAIETADAAPAPSETARARLRRAVQAELAPAPRRSWEMPVTFAAAAVLVLVASAATRAVTSGPGAPPYALHETGAFRR